LNNVINRFATLSKRRCLQLNQTINAAQRKLMKDRLKINANGNRLAQINMKCFAFAFGQAFKNRIVQPSQPFRPASMLGNEFVIVVATRVNIVRHAADAASAKIARVAFAIGAGNKHVSSQMVLGLGDVKRLDGGVVVVALKGFAFRIHPLIAVLGVVTHTG
jgi:hypothetical protein